MKYLPQYDCIYLNEEIKELKKWEKLHIVVHTLTTTLIGKHTLNVLSLKEV